MNTFKEFLVIVYAFIEDSNNVFNKWERHETFGRNCNHQFTGQGKGTKIKGDGVAI